MTSSIEILKVFCFPPIVIMPHTPQQQQQPQQQRFHHLLRPHMILTMTLTIPLIQLRPQVVMDFSPNNDDK